MITNNKQKGFTFIETIIYIAIIGAIVIAFVGFALSVSSSKNKNYAAQEVQANLRFAMDLITQKIKKSAGVNISSSTFDIDPGVLSLEMVEVSENPTIFDLNADDGLLKITQGTSSPIFLVSNEIKITNLIFNNLTASSSKENIKIQVTAEFNDEESKGYEHIQSLQTSASTRR